MDRKIELAYILGELYKTYGYRVPTARVNDYLTQLGKSKSEKTNKQELIELVQELDTVPELKSAYTQVRDGKVSLYDVLKKDINKMGTKTKKDWDQKVVTKISPSVVHQLEVSQYQRELKKDIRTGAMMTSLMNGVSDELKDTINSLPKETVPYVSPKEEKLAYIDITSDMHIGALVDLPNNQYSWDIAQKRLMEHTRYAMSTAKAMGLSTIYEVNIGDLVEQSYLHYSSSMNCEFPLATQVANATGLVVKQLQLMQSGFHVIFSIIAGNHDRYSGDKSKEMFNDSVAFTVLSTIKLMQESGQLKNVEVLDNSQNIYRSEFDVLGHHVLLTHGEALNRKKTDNVSRLGHEVQPDLVIAGHYHTFSTWQEEGHATVVIAASLKGTDQYATRNELGNAEAGQSAVILSENSNHPWVSTYYFNDVSKR